MKIVTREQFLQLPAGTVYIDADEYTPHRTICVKHKDIPHYPEAVDPDDFETHAVQPGNVEFGFDPARIYYGFPPDAVVFERDDLLQLRALIDRALELSGGEG